jgi:hypothetical protein
VRRFRAFSSLLVLAVLAAACSQSTGGNNPGPTLPGGGGLPSSLVGGAMDTGSRSGDGSVIDPQGLTKLASEKVCTLLSAEEAGSILGEAVTGTPSGMLVDGLGTNCIYDTASGASIKIEFNVAGYQAQVALIGIGGSAPKSLTVAGRQAAGVEAPSDPNAFIKAQLAVNLGTEPKNVALYVEAPTLAKAEQVATTVVPRIPGLK